jgi:hypothetical protein
MLPRCYEPHWIVLLPILITALCALPVIASGDEQLPQGTLSGTIVDPDSQPVAGARIWINTWEDKLLVEGVSEADGRFRLGPTEPVYRHFADVVIDADGFARQYILGGSYSIYAGADCAAGEKRSLDIACVDGGTINGTVTNRPAPWSDHLWIVAFTDTGVRAETRVKPDGTFSFRQLPPGRYGLKVGHDTFHDSEVAHGPVSEEAWNTVSDPWKRATAVELSPGQESPGIELQLPQD